MKFTDIVRDHYRGPAYGQEFTTWYTKVQHGFSTAQVPESAQVDHLVAVLDSPAQELAFSFIKKYNAEHPTEGLRGQQLVQYHEDKLAALVAHLQSKSSVVGTRPELRLLNKWKTMKQYDGEPAAMFYHRINVLHDQLANQPDPEVPGPRDVWSTFVNGLQHDVQLHVHPCHEWGREQSRLERNAVHARQGAHRLGDERSTGKPRDVPPNGVAGRRSEPTPDRSEATSSKR